MRQKTLVIFASTLAGVTLLFAGSALANPFNECPFAPGCNTETETTPEPGTIIGTLVIGSAMAWKKLASSKKA